MRSPSRRLPRLATLLACAGLLAACATPAIVLKYQPDTPLTAWEGRKPKIHFSGVTDRTNGFSAVGIDRVNRGGSPPRLVALTPSVDRVLGDAFISELKRLDVPLVEVREADAQISLVLGEARASWVIGHAVRDEGVIKFALIVRGRDNRIIRKDEVIGKGQSSRTHAGCCPGNGPNEAINNALADAMNQIDDLFINGDLAAQIFGDQRQALIAPQPAQAASLSDIDEVPSAKPARRKAHAVVIGVERYRHQLPTADFAAADAHLMSKYLTEVLGFPPDNVAVLVNDGVTKGDIEKYVERWLPNRVEAGDEVLVYYSGHGAPNSATGEAYLVPYDGDPMYLEQTGYPLDKLYEQLAKLPSKEVTVVLDSCFSGAGGRSVIAKGARPLVNVAAKQALPGNVKVLSAAAGNQLSQSYQEMGHGLFTYFFLKGLGRQAQKGEVNLRQAFDFAAPQVRQTARREYNTDQVPQWQEGR